MNSRVLPVLNLVGCLVLTGLLIMQWRKEHMLDQAAMVLRKELTKSQAETATETKRRITLENDIKVLKEAMEACQSALETTNTSLAEKQQHAERLGTELTAAREQVAAWEAALKQRDERIGTLDAELKKTRTRLDEAITRLDQAGAR